MLAETDRKVVGDFKSIYSKEEDYQTVRKSVLNVASNMLVNTSVEVSDRRTPGEGLCIGQMVLEETHGISLSRPQAPTNHPREAEPSEASARESVAGQTG